MAVDLSQFVTGGATRPDSISGFNPDFASSLAALIAAAPPDVRSALQISSGYRSVDRQRQLWDEALKKYGSPGAARKWVAPPGRSNHNHGMAADLRYGSAAARQWAHANAGNHGLAFPLGNENWHIELASARGGKPHAHATAPTPALPKPSPGVAGPAASAPGRAPIAAMFADPAFVEPPSLGGLVLGMLQQNGQRRRQQEEEAAAEQARRNALFGADLYG